ncbi:MULTISPECIES: DUF3558 domain-containing protein [unclassified Streptomyces]|uniref:DUF3558 domain-containing protein n=1 Tax=unclassified Streptomyces TaxID=2593676 RepID=UPI0022B5F08F|nr:MULTISPECIES: DUF3558 domain-containing protein [unclassified Streptomyces]MCZ7417420.1 DUF3558 domain-containing protein [Streptomyces sp. WMMC897]MCZ7432752.1 DUF3558 domain-containing protein [Streptomyces sp. WMMC1477]
MRRRAYLGGPAALAALTVVLTGCTDGVGGGPNDGKSDASASSTPDMKPGRYRTLPEPCGSLDRDALRKALFPEGGGEGSTASAHPADSVLDGEAAVTFDTDRRVGCSWKSSTPLGSRHLTLDFERVVSYDPEVSDDDRALELFDLRAAEAGIPAEPPTGDAGEDGDGGSDGDGEETGEPSEEPSGSASPPASGTASDEPASAAAKDAGDDAGAPDDGGGATQPATAGQEPPPTDGATGDGPSGRATPGLDPELAPRPLDDVGENAYLDDELVTADAGVHRDVTLVFRTGNVIVTVQYNQWSTDKRRLPDSEELQRQADRLAKQIARRLDS